MDFFGLLKPIEIAVAWIMVQFHSALSAMGMRPESGWTWALSIVGLVIVIRILLIPLFVKQIKASRGLQLIQPEMKKIQAKYKGKTDQASRQAMTQETMELYKRTGTNPFASCLPILLQSPIFFALFRVLNYGIRNESGIGALTPELAKQAGESTIFGVKLTDTFLQSTTLNVKILTVILIILMSATTFTTQKQLMTKNMPASALDNPFAQQQKILLYVLPLIFAVSGVNFPVGVLLYWLTTNVWSMGQQLFVIRRMPAPGSAAEKALLERRARKGKSVLGFGGSSAVSQEAEETEQAAAQPRGQRVQPKRKDRQRKGKGGARPTAATPSSSSSDASASESASSETPSDAVADGSGAKPAAGSAAAGPAAGKSAPGKPAPGKPAAGKPAGSKNGTTARGGKPKRPSTGKPTGR
ncbi:MAG TPA: membrane protein insertase YidC [Actinomycetales bacterium]|nr:membrane protein insertase YidC [Actinomycetales bacterium]